MVRSGSHGWPAPGVVNPSRPNKLPTLTIPHLVGCAADTRVRRLHGHHDPASNVEGVPNTGVGRHVLAECMQSSCYSGRECRKDPFITPFLPGVRGAQEAPPETELDRKRREKKERQAARAQKFMR